MPSPGELTTLAGRLGGLYDPEGRRVMICLRIEDPDRHLRWVFYRYLRDNVYGRLAGSRRRVLLFGDRMANTVGPGESFTDYVTLLERVVADDRRTLQFGARSGGKLPTLRDLVLFAKTLAGLDQAPDIVVLCPGLADVTQAVGERDFARSIDVMVDCVRRVSDRAKVVVVSPPPYPLNRRRSDLYTRELKRVIRDHHLPFVNLTELLAEGKEDWMAQYYAAPLAEGILLQNPNQAAHRAIAEAILDELR
jgi:lysophospholipase L1-like esterase